MRILIIVVHTAFVFLIFGCGVESVGTAAIAAKQQAEQAKQAKENLDTIKKNIDAAANEAELNRKKAEEAAGS